MTTTITCMGSDACESLFHYSDLPEVHRGHLCSRPMLTPKGTLAIAWRRPPCCGPSTRRAPWSRVLIVLTASYALRLLLGLQRSSRPSGSTRCPSRSSSGCKLDPELSSSAEEDEATMMLNEPKTTSDVTTEMEGGTHYTTYDNMHYQDAPLRVNGAGDYYHMSTRPPDGSSALLIDPGSVGNLCGDQWARKLGLQAIDAWASTVRVHQAEAPSAFRGRPRFAVVQ